MVKAVAMNNFNLTSINWNNHELSQPEWLWLIPILIGINVFLILIKKNHLNKSEPASLINSSSKNQLLHPLFNSLSLKTGELKNKPTYRLLHSLIFILLIFSLTQPVRIGEKLPEPPKERDIIFIVDTSVSMILRDYVLNGERIDRMSLLKGVLDSFISKLKGERISIIVFGDNAYTLVPLTSDQLLLRRMLARVKVTMAGRFNAMGEAIALAVKQATQNDANTGHISKRKRILVLLTDADQPTGEFDPYVAANLAKRANLPLYTIAIGATSAAAQEQTQGGLLYSPVDLSLIQKLSKSTGAKSYQAGKENALEDAIKTISLHETNKRNVEPLYFREPLYFWFLIAALLLFSFNQLLTLFKTIVIKNNSSGIVSTKTSTSDNVTEK